MVVDFMKLNIKGYSNNDIVRFLREYSSLTQKQLADKLNKNVRTIQRYESGDIKIDFDIIRNICEICDLTLTIESKINHKNKN